MNFTVEMLMESDDPHSPYAAGFVSCLELAPCTTPFLFSLSAFCRRSSSPGPCRSPCPLSAGAPAIEGDGLLPLCGVDHPGRTRPFLQPQVG